MITFSNIGKSAITFQFKKHIKEKISVSSKQFSAIRQNFRGQCPRVPAFSHVCFWAGTLVLLSACNTNTNCQPHLFIFEENLSNENYKNLPKNYSYTSIAHRASQ